MLTSSPSTHGFQPGLRGYASISTLLASFVGWEEATSVTTGGTAGPRNKDAHVPYPLTQAELDPSVLGQPVLPAEDGSGSPEGAVAVEQVSVHGACQEAPSASLPPRTTSLSRCCASSHKPGMLMVLLAAGRATRESRSWGGSHHGTPSIHIFSENWSVLSCGAGPGMAGAALCRHGTATLTHGSGKAGRKTSSLLTTTGENAD